MAAEYRTEKDLLGERKVPAGALYGVHADRARENFPIAGRRVHSELIRAYGAVKLACARTNHELGWWDERKFDAIARACAEMSEGLLDEHVIVDAFQGGAGTSTNMNVNEVLANRAIQLLGRAAGEYDAVSPTDDLNLHQSTNDTFPTALKVAAIRMLRELERQVVALLEEFQRREKETADVVKIARTEMQDAVLITVGREMAAYAEAFGRDRWRIYKCEERLRVVNLGGTAVGTGIGTPREFIFRAIDHLREITRLGLARAENLVEATQNTDVFVEVSGILKALASNLVKVSGDLRLLSSGPDAGIGEITLPQRQAGSSIMPGKVNPVIPEAVTQAGIDVMAADQAIATACSMGSLELNPFMPLIADKLLGSLGILTRACDVLRRHCVAGLAADRERCRRHVAGGTAAVTALVERIGYAAASAIAERARETGKTIRQVAVDAGAVTDEEFDELVAPERVTRLGTPIRRENK